MIANNIKNVAGLFAVLLLVSVVGISLPATSVNANEVKEVSTCDFYNPGDNGLIKDAVVHDIGESGSFFRSANPKMATISENVALDLDPSLNIKSETDLENYLNNDTSNGSSVDIHTNSFYGGCNNSGDYQVVAIWTSTDYEYNHPSAKQYGDMPQLLKNKLGIQDYLDAKALQEKKNNAPTNTVTGVVAIEPGKPVENKVGDPDGSCSSAYVCFYHTDGGSTGFHSSMCYTGRWDGVFDVRKLTSLHVDVTTIAGQYIELKAERSTFDPAASFNNVNIG